MRTFFSYIGLILLGLALMLLGADMITTLEHPDQVTLRSFQTVWAAFNAGAVDAFVVWLGAACPDFVRTAVLFVLAIPAWSIGFVGFFIAFFAGHKKNDDE